MRSGWSRPAGSPDHPRQRGSLHAAERDAGHRPCPGTPSLHTCCQTKPCKVLLLLIFFPSHPQCLPGLGVTPRGALSGTTSRWRGLWGGAARWEEQMLSPLRPSGKPINDCCASCWRRVGLSGAVCHAFTRLFGPQHRRTRVSRHAVVGGGGWCLRTVTVTLQRCFLVTLCWDALWALPRGTRPMCSPGLGSPVAWDGKVGGLPAGRRVARGTLPGLERFCSVLLGRVCGTPGALTAQRQGWPAFSEPVGTAGTSAWPASDLGGITGHRVTCALRHIILGTTST